MVSKFFSYSAGRDLSHSEVPNSSYSNSLIELNILTHCTTALSSLSVISFPWIFADSSDPAWPTSSLSSRLLRTPRIALSFQVFHCYFHLFALYPKIQSRSFLPSIVRIHNHVHLLRFVPLFFFLFCFIRNAGDREAAEEQEIATTEPKTGANRRKIQKNNHKAFLPQSVRLLIRD